MRWIVGFFRGLRRDEEAATTVEYAVVLALILMAVFMSIGVVGARSGGLWGGVVSSMEETIH